MMRLKHIARRAAAVGAPLMQSRTGRTLLSAGSIAFPFLEGLGAGAGWDMRNEVAAAAGFVRGSNPVIIDVGANKGAWSEQLSSILAQPTASFYLFEVAPYCFAEIAQRETNIANCTVVRQAVSDRVGSATLHLPKSFSGLASLHPRHDVGVLQREYDELVVSTTTLDHFAAERGLDRIALIKLDIEGHELSALKGAESLLGEKRVDALTFEFGSANVNSRTFFRDFWDLLTNHGYALHRIVPGGKLAPVSDYSERLEYFRGATNYVASLRV